MSRAFLVRVLAALLAAAPAVAGAQTVPPRVRGGATPVQPPSDVQQPVRHAAEHPEQMQAVTVERPKATSVVRTPLRQVTTPIHTPPSEPPAPGP